MQSNARSWREKQEEGKKFVLNPFEKAKQYGKKYGKKYIINPFENAKQYAAKRIRN